MTPTSFQFQLTVPGDSRLVTVVRELTAHAASYANLDTGISQEFAQRVADATATAITGTGAQNAPIELRFDGDAETIRVTITWPRHNGSTETRELRQRVAS